MEVVEQKEQWTEQRNTDKHAEIELMRSDAQDIGVQILQIKYFQEKRTRNISFLTGQYGQTFDNMGHATQKCDAIIDFPCGQILSYERKYHNLFSLTDVPFFLRSINTKEKYYLTGHHTLENCKIYFFSAHI